MLPYSLLPDRQKYLPRTAEVTEPRYLTSMLRRIADHPVNRISELLPWNLFPGNPMATEPA